MTIIHEIISDKIFFILLVLSHMKQISKTIVLLYSHINLVTYPFPAFFQVPEFEQV